MTACWLSGISMLQGCFLESSESALWRPSETRYPEHLHHRATGWFGNRVKVDNMQDIEAEVKVVGRTVSDCVAEIQNGSQFSIIPDIISQDLPRTLPDMPASTYYWSPRSSPWPKVIDALWG